MGFATLVSSADVSDDWELLNKYAKKSSIAPVAPKRIIPPNLLEYYADIPPIEWMRDGISKETLQKYHIHFNIADNEAIIPHYDMDGNLIGIRSRSFDEAKIAAGCKYMPTVLQGEDFRHSLRNYLYGLNFVKEGILKSKKICLVEAEKSAMQSYTMYKEGSFTVALCGSNISTIQRDIVLSLGVKEVFLALDKEYEEAYTPEADQYADKLIRLAGMFTPYVTTWILFDTQGLLRKKDSPTDRGRKVLEELMKTKFEIETKKEE